MTGSANRNSCFTGAGRGLRFRSSWLCVYNPRIMMKKSERTRQRIIETAKIQHALETGKRNGATVEGTDLDRYLKAPYAAIDEPSGYDYVIGDVGQDPICTYGGTHVIGGL